MFERMLPRMSPQRLGQPLNKLLILVIHILKVKFGATAAAAAAAAASAAAIILN
jgi:hypothetical protein